MSSSMSGETYNKTHRASAFSINGMVWDAKDVGMEPTKHEKNVKFLVLKYP